MTSPTTIKQRKITIELESRKIVVHRMKWQAARAFIKKLAAHLSSAGTNLENALASLPSLITNAEELAVDLVVNSTELKAEQLDELDVAEFAAILAAAVDLNLGDELKNSYAGISGTLTALMPAMRTTPGQ